MKFVLLAVLCIGSISCFKESEHNEKFQKASKEVHRICMEETGITQEAIDNVKKGNFDDDSKTKKYNNCLWTRIKVMNEKFELDEKLLKDLLPERIRDVQLKFIIECLEETRAAAADLESVEKTYLLTKCIYNKKPENWFYI
uniref:Odorant-binding protein 23 n=1 Tax=Pyrrhalta aenescens TaxID=281545 RepID=A0A1J0KKL4_9CUCU|nr:odorant-binding protein 23 [Pyrrhalta aenescens]